MPAIAIAHCYLSVNVQLCENVRTGRQLMPIVLLHLFQCLYLLVSYAVSYTFFTMSDPENIILGLARNLLSALVYLLIQLALIMCGWLCPSFKEGQVFAPSC